MAESRGLAEGEGLFGGRVVDGGVVDALERGYRFETILSLH